MRTVLLALWAIAGAVEITSSHGRESHAEVRADGSVKAAMMRREKDEHMVGHKEADPDESDVENGDGEAASDNAASQTSASDGPASNITVTVNITDAANTTGTANTTASTNTTETANATATTDKKRSVDDTSEKSDSGDSDSSDKEEPTKDQQSADSTDSTADSTADSTGDSASTADSTDSTADSMGDSASTADSTDSTADSTGDSASTADSPDSTADSTGDSAAETAGDSAAESPNSADSTEEAEQGNDDSKQSQDETAAFINLKARKPLQHAGSKDSSDQQKPATHNTHVKTGASKAKATASKTETSSKHLHEKNRKHASLLAQDPETTVTTTYYFTLVSTNKYCANAQSGYKKNVGNYKTKACFEYVLAENSCGKYFDFGVVDGACDCVPKSHAECKEADAENYHVYLIQKGGPEALVEVDDQGMAVKVNGYAVHSHLD